MSRNLSLTIVALLFSLTAFAAADDYKNWWKMGNKLFINKEYELALHQYNEIAKLDPANAEVYYNIGNTYYRLNDVGHAVLNYEKALHLQPSFTKAADNLYLTQNRINNRIPQMPEIFFVQWWKSVTRPGLADTYAVSALILFLLSLGYYIARMMGKMPVAVRKQVPMAVLVITVVFISLGLVAGSRKADSGLGVILTEGTPMMAESKPGKSLSLVPEGTTVEISSIKTGWVEIKLPDGRTGWVPEASIAKV